MNGVNQLNALGQSIWYDNVQRSLLISGELENLIDLGVTGVTSNPSIFERAINGSADYDESIRNLAGSGLSADAIYDVLSQEDIRTAANLLRPVYDRTQGADGYVSLEVSPRLAHDTEGTIREAHRLVQQLGLPNVMIKVPATDEGIPAIRKLIRDGVNVNVTLIFNLQNYEHVINAYLSGLEDRILAGQPVAGISSVASFFISRVDSLVDKRIQELGANESLLGQAAITNAVLAYGLFERQFSSPRFIALQQRGASVQRPLWASTSTKNPNYAALYYVRALAVENTVNTMPPPTVQTVLESGETFGRSAAFNVDSAQYILGQIESSGISMSDMTGQLQREGVAAFIQSFQNLIGSLELKTR